ncbi:MAG: hypothetical protein EU530_02770 [Promethearchaeota archaeon]|nr:MAG: hypothetical protein EU530_02770 [Candidatus Lokiarchaeota archaeon]
MWKTQNSLEYRITAKTELIYKRIVKFWIVGVNILAFFYTLLSYTEELFAKEQILQGIRMAEQDLNMPDKLEVE